MRRIDGMGVFNHNNFISSGIEPSINPLRSWKVEEMDAE
jgi:hypothetical protein